MRRENSTSTGVEEHIRIGGAKTERFFLKERCEKRGEKKKGVNNPEKHILGGGGPNPGVEFELLQKGVELKGTERETTALKNTEKPLQERYRGENVNRTN